MNAQSTEDDATEAPHCDRKLILWICLSIACSIIGDSMIFSPKWFYVALIFMVGAAIFLLLSIHDAIKPKS